MTAASSNAAAQEIGKEICIDELITDCRMPKADGLEVIRDIRAHQPNLPAIIVTANIAVLDLLLEDTQTEIFDKPMNMNEMLACINIMLGIGTAQFFISPLAF